MLIKILSFYFSMIKLSLYKKLEFQDKYSELLNVKVGGQFDLTLAVLSRKKARQC